MSSVATSSDYSKECIASNCTKPRVGKSYCKDHCGKCIDLYSRYKQICKSADSILDSKTEVPELYKYKRDIRNCRIARMDHHRQCVKNIDEGHKHMIDRLQSLEDESERQLNLIRREQSRKDTSDDFRNLNINTSRNKVKIKEEIKEEIDDEEDNPPVVEENKECQKQKTKRKDKCSKIKKYNDDIPIDYSQPKDVLSNLKDMFNNDYMKVDDCFNSIVKEVEICGDSEEYQNISDQSNKYKQGKDRWKKVKPMNVLSELKKVDRDSDEYYNLRSAHGGEIMNKVITKVKKNNANKKIFFEGIIQNMETIINMVKLKSDSFYSQAVIGPDVRSFIKKKYSNLIDIEKFNKYFPHEFVKDFDENNILTILIILETVDKKPHLDMIQGELEEIISIINLYFRMTEIHGDWKKRIEKSLLNQAHSPFHKLWIHKWNLLSSKSEKVEDILSTIKYEEDFFYLYCIFIIYIREKYDMWKMLTQTLDKFTVSYYEGDESKKIKILKLIINFIHTHELLHIIKYTKKYNDDIYQIFLDAWKIESVDKLWLNSEVDKIFPKELPIAVIKSE